MSEPVQEARTWHVFACVHERHNTNATHMKRFPPASCEFCSGWDAVMKRARQACRCSICEPALRGLTRQSCTRADAIACALAEQRDSAPLKHVEPVAWRIMSEKLGQIGGIYKDHAMCLRRCAARNASEWSHGKPYRIETLGVIGVAP